MTVFEKHKRNKAFKKIHKIAKSDITDFIQKWKNVLSYIEIVSPIHMKFFRIEISENYKEWLAMNKAWQVLALSQDAQAGAGIMFARQIVSKHVQSLIPQHKIPSWIAFLIGLTFLDIFAEQDIFERQRLINLGLPISGTETKNAANTRDIHRKKSGE